MQVQVLFGYTEQIIPPRCRKPRPAYFDDGVTTIEIREVTADQAPVAIRARGIRDWDETKPYALEYRWFDGGLWTPMATADASPRSRSCGANDWDYPQWPSTLDLRRHESRNVNWEFDYDEPCMTSTRNEVLDHLRDYAGAHLIVDGVAHRPVGEPRYVVMTFGLGRNHGGTACMISDGYNGNIAHSYYFSLLDKAKAIDLATRIATERGDTKSLPIEPHGPEFEVLLPEAILVDPAKQHGEGDPFLNTLDAMSRASGGSPAVGLAAGLMAISSAKA